jgi:hypothetical protein
VIKIPLPTPRKGEKKNDFISRCIRTIDDEYEHDQAIAICYRQWSKKKN